MRTDVVALAGRIVVLGALLGLGSCDRAEREPSASGRVAIGVAPLSLPGVDEACYDLKVTNAPGGAGDTVWSKDGVCSTRYGDGAGSIAYVGTCDAGSGSDNTVVLTLTSLGTPTGPASFVNPCGAPDNAPCQLETACHENADSAVEFDLTVMRDADQGFFDVAVTFEDLFCSGKVDCTKSDGGGAIELLYGPDGGARVPTVVMALACTGGLGADTMLYLDGAALQCGDVTVPLPVSGAPGNVYGPGDAPPAPLLQVATYRGRELLADEHQVPWSKLYYNVALALDFAHVTAPCHLVASATASDGAFASAFATPAHTTYPVIRVDVPLADAGDDAYGCTQQPLGRTAADGIWTDYTAPDAPATFDHRARFASNAVVIDDAPIGIAVPPGGAPATFPETFVGLDSASQDVTITATGPGHLAVGAATTSGDFAVADNRCAAWLAPGDTCTIAVVFAPTAGGPRSGALHVASDAGTGVLDVALSGTGRAPDALVVTPPSITLAPGYATTFAASGGVLPYHFALSGNGALTPAALTAGYVASTPGASSLRVTDQLGAFADASITINPALAIAPAQVTLAVGNTQSFGSSGGVGAVSLSLAGGDGSLVGALYTAPATAGSAIVRATDAYGGTADAAITINPALQISPTTATVAIHATQSFSASGGAGGDSYSVVTSNGGTFNGAVYTAPAAAGSYTVRVTDQRGNTSDAVVTVFNPAPTITGISPNVGPNTGGTNVGISGSNFSFGALASVKIDGVACTNAVWAATNIQCKTPAGTNGAKNVVVTNGDGSSAQLDSGFTYTDPEGWTTMSTSGQPSARYLHAAVWIGNKMLVANGTDNGSSAKSDAYLYDPATNTWATTGAPTFAAFESSIVWTGSVAIMWGGHADGDGGGSYSTGLGSRYNPANGTWSATSTSGNAPTARREHVALWTGSEMIIWGGYNNISNTMNSGARYDPTTNTWTTMSTTNAPSARMRASAVWTGSKMLVWGGQGGETSGGIYDPATNTWSAMATANGPGSRDDQVGVWTGSRFVVWGGYSPFPTVPTTGAAYDPATNTWTQIATAGAPTGRTDPGFVWTGSKLIVWSGGNGQPDGGVYDAAANTWVATSMTNAPQTRVQFPAVWTGSKMIVWGGFNSVPINGGGLYTPSL